MRKNDMCDIQIEFVNRTPISLKAVYDKPKYDEKGNLLVMTEKSVEGVYFFKEVTPKELMAIRLERKPDGERKSGVVYKRDGKLFFASIPGDLKLTKANSGHMCGRNCANICKDCTRTRDLTVSFQERYGKEYPYSIWESWRIEKYDYITEGMEAFNMHHVNDALMVYGCKNFVPSSRSDTTAKMINADLKTSLANFFWPDFDGDLKAMRKRIRENEEMKAG